MHSLLLSKLATSNIKKNSKTYLPYILTSIGIIAMFYNMVSLAVNSSLKLMAGGGSMQEMLKFGTWIIGIFSLIFLFYINSFLMKRRKKEFGLYNILGMEKKHIAKIAAFETLYISIISIASGILCGLLLNKLMYLLLLKILHLEIKMGFEISPVSLILTSAVFALIFCLIFIYNMLQIKSAKPIELLSGGKSGEKEPKTKFIMTITGLICLIAAYYISLTTESPIDTLGLFFVAVILVIIGTYFLFIAGSIALLKLLRKNKKYYYKKNHFTTVSGMIYRMKQNAAGLAGICILSTMVLVTLSTTVSLYIGVEDVLRERFPKNIAVTSMINNESDGKAVISLADTVMKSENLAPDSALHYFISSMYLEKNGNCFSNDTEASSNVNTKLVLFTLEDYNRIANKSEQLSPGQILVYSKENTDYKTLKLGQSEYEIKGIFDSSFLDTVRISNITQISEYYVVVQDCGTIHSIRNNIKTDINDENQTPPVELYYGFDISADNDTQAELTGKLKTILTNEFEETYVTGAAVNRNDFYQLYGCLFFLGIFLGLLFLMATVLIIYYKQISEGYDDRERFNIMQKIGMSKAEIKKAIRSQILTVFFLPLAAACVHIAFAFKIITKLLQLFNMTNISLFILCTIGVVLIFILLYTIVYSLTAKAYYKIVK